MNISGQHTFLVPNAKLPDVQKIVQDKQAQAMKDGWQPSAGAPQFKIIRERDKSKVTFDVPDNVFEEIKRDVDVLREVIELFKDIGNFFESIAKSIWPF